MGNALTQLELDDIECANPQCEHDSCELVVIAKCHPRDGVRVIYSKEYGVLMIECIACKAWVADIKVAP